MKLQQFCIVKFINNWCPLKSWNASIHHKWADQASQFNTTWSKECYLEVKQPIAKLHNTVMKNALIYQQQNAVANVKLPSFSLIHWKLK